MKKILLFWVVLGGLSLSAQNVVIPDIQLKNKLVATVCADFNNDGIYDGDADTNDDGEIQLAEAAAVFRLKLNNATLPNTTSIIDLTGIQAFANCKELQLVNNTLSIFDAALPNLEILKVSQNSLQSIDLNGVPLLKDLDCSQNQLATLDLQPVGLLESLKSDFNSLGSINLEYVANLTFLSLQQCQLTNLNLSVVPNLIYLKISGNNFVPNLNPATNLKTLIARNMGLTNLNLSVNTNLLLLDLSENNFSDFTFPSLPSLTTLTIDSCTSLQSINVNALTALSFLEINNAPQLLSINAKNGRTAYQSLSCQNLDALLYVCTDVATIDDFQTALQAGGQLGVQINDYCTLTPGGNYNTISGQIRFDLDQNGCDLNDNAASFVKVNQSSVDGTVATFTSGLNGYTHYTTQVNTPYSLTPQWEQPNYFTTTPNTASVTFSQLNGLQATQDFCLVANGIAHDAEITLAPEALLRPGFTNTLRLFIRNKGNQTISGSFMFTYEQGKVSVLSSSIPFTNQSQGQLVWDYTNLLPFQSQVVELEVYVNNSSQVPPVAVGDSLGFSVAITTNGSDVTPSDNSLLYEGTTVASYEPNNIICLEGDQLPLSAIGSFVHYMVNFENTGTVPAQQVVVRLDVDPTEFNMDTLQILETSAPSYARQRNNRIEIFYPNLQIDTGGHGNVLMKIRSKDNLGNGDLVNGRADIFFDYNEPLDTGITQTVYQDLKETEFESGVTLEISPIPAKDNITIQASSTLLKVEVFDVQGRLLQIHLDQATTVNLNVENYHAGNYFLRVHTKDGVVVRKIVIE